MSLFDWRQKQLTDKEAPLAARMRPRTLDEYFGQDEIVGPGRLLRRAIQADQLSSVIFYGPPGTGKTTLARIIANTTQGNFVALNAVLSGVKDIRAAIEKANDARGQHGQRTILFVDEVHRFNKAQQDALLPWVENGTVILVGATTENPYFEVNKALVSRSRIFQLKPLEEAGLRKVVEATLADKERGYGSKNVRLDEDALAHLVNVANGDARAALNALELAIDTTDEIDGEIHVSLSVAEESIQRRAVLYDKEGDAHFDAISAFIKSCRGSDPDAALYWLARMVYAGEDPRYIFRRMVILASEDVGLASPDVLARVLACASSFDRIGMPEGRFPLSQAALILATAPKSNSVMGFFDALKSVKDEREGEVPNHLKDKSRDSKAFGHGDGYLYPHAYQDHWVAQQYLPDTLRGQVFYQPSDVGFERTIKQDVERRREAQLAASEDSSMAAPLGLTFGPKDRRVERWLERAVEQSGQRLGEIRDRLFEQAELQRHHVVLDLAGGSGLLTWEAVRRAPEGGVYSRTDPGDRRLADRSRSLPELTRPVAVSTELAGIDTEIDADVTFDRIIGHNALVRVPDKAGMAAWMFGRCRAGGRVTLAESVPKHAQRLYALVDCDLEPELIEGWRDAEEAIYADEQDPAINWDAASLCRDFERAGFEIRHGRALEAGLSMTVSAAMVDRWLDGTGDRTSYSERLSGLLSAEEVEAVRAWAKRKWLSRTVRWVQTTVYLTAVKA